MTLCCHWTWSRHISVNVEDIPDNVQCKSICEYSWTLTVNHYQCSVILPPLRSMSHDSLNHLTSAFAGRPGRRLWVKPVPCHIPAVIATVFAAVMTATMHSECGTGLTQRPRQLKIRHDGIYLRLDLKLDDLGFIRWRRRGGVSQKWTSKRATWHTNVTTIDVVWLKVKVTKLRLVKWDTMRITTLE